MVEIGAIVIENGRIQFDQVFHRFIDPQRDIPPEVVCIHGIDAQKLADEGAQPFSEISREFCEFVQGSTLVFHNAPFDLGFINHEIRRAGLPGITNLPVIDSLTIARQRYPKQANNLDALCDRLHIDRSQRQLHGALIDATLTAQVYLTMINQDYAPQPASLLSDMAAKPVADQKLSDLMLYAYDELEHRHSHRIPVSMPRSPALYRYTGPMQAGEVITITRKSHMQLLNVATGIANHAAFHTKPAANVMIFSLMITALDWTIGLLASEAHINPDRIHTGNLRPSDWRKLASTSEKMMDGKLHICDAKTITMVDIRSKCYQMDNRDRRLDLIIIDDFQTIADNEIGAEHNTYDITRALKSLAAELDAPIILLSRQGRSSDQADSQPPRPTTLTRIQKSNEAVKN